ncbi:MAG: ferrous iron transport protein B [Mariprofundus sp.]|nr:ferrous iron transport protein B [Mariprofundus sp.]
MASWQIMAEPQRPFRGERRLRVALVGQPMSGKSEIFKVVSSAFVERGNFSGTAISYDQCGVRVGVDEIDLIDLPSFFSLRHLQGDNLEGLKYLLWGDSRPLISAHESDLPPAPFSSPDVIVHVVDATVLGRSLELSLELATLGKPVVLAVNMIDQAKSKGIDIDCGLLSERLGIPVVPTSALEGVGIAELFDKILETARDHLLPIPHALPKHISRWKNEAHALLVDNNVYESFDLSPAFLLAQLLEGDEYFSSELKEHFPDVASKFAALQKQADAVLPRDLAAEIDVDRHHRGMSISERVTGFGEYRTTRSWGELFDNILLHPHWGILTSSVMFAAILYVVFEFSGLLDSVSSAPLMAWLGTWQADSMLETIVRAVVEGLVGLVGIVVPYMIPLVLLMVFLELSGLMSRIAFVVDRLFHHIGLSGNVAVPFLLGLGCNVPAISSLASIKNKRDQVVATLMATFIPCSARSAIILALGGMYLGGLGVFAIFMVNILIIAVLSRLLTWSFPDPTPGQVMSMPVYQMPKFSELMYQSWRRIEDVLTIVTPLLVGGTVILALMQMADVDAMINSALAPITFWWLGLPAVLGVPLLFGILRKELSLAMMFQALGVVGIAGVQESMDWVQVLTFIVFVTFYVPCVSTMAIQIKVIGVKMATYSVLLSTGVALIVAMVIRLLAEGGRYVFA